METVRGRQRPKGFVVKTATFTRKTDDGEEEVTTPILGLIVQSSALMWSPLVSLDESQGPLYELPVEVTRRGTDQNTRYDFVSFLEAPVDLSPVIRFIDGISYISEDLEDVVSAVEATDTPLAAVQAVAEALFDRRIAELSDKERYDSLVGPIESLPERFGSGKKKPSQARPSRPARPSPRPEPTSENGSEEAEAAPSKEERFATLKARFENK